MPGLLSRWQSWHSPTPTTHPNHFQNGETDTSEPDPSLDAARCAGTQLHLLRGEGAPAGRAVAVAALFRGALGGEICGDFGVVSSGRIGLMWCLTWFSFVSLRPNVNC